MYRAQATFALTLTPWLAALVLHTQTAKVASLPGLTVDEVEKDCTRTHSCAVAGDGDGLGELLALGLGVGLALAVVFLVADELGFGLAVGLALLVGLALALELALALVVGLALLVEDELALAEASALRTGPTAAVSAALFGIDAQPVLTIGAPAALTASAWLNAAEATNAKPQTPAITAGLTSCALTGCSFRLDRPEPS